MRRRLGEGEGVEGTTEGLSEAELIGVEWDTEEGEGKAALEKGTVVGEVVGGEETGEETRGDTEKEEDKEVWEEEGIIGTIEDVVLNEGIPEEGRIEGDEDT